MAKRVSKEERETIIRFDETDGPVVIYTFNADLKKRLKGINRLTARVLQRFSLKLPLIIRALLRTPTARRPSRRRFL